MQIAKQLLAAAPIQVAANIIQNPNGQVVQGGLTLQGLLDLLNVVVTWMMIIGVVVGAIFIVWGGIQYVFAGGESEKSDKAKKHLFNGIIGIAIILAVGLIVNTLIKIFSGGAGGGGLFK